VLRKFDSTKLGRSSSDCRVRISTGGVVTTVLPWREPSGSQHSADRSRWECYGRSKSRSERSRFGLG
jgi:hypothetical protein